MQPLDNILGAIDGLTYEEKLKLRLVLDKQLGQHPLETGNATRYPIIGLLADEPELADHILESAMIARETRPYRIPSE